MIPVHTSVPSRYPPVITWTLITTNCVVFLLQINMSTWELNRFIFHFALIPARYLERGYVDLSPDDLLPFLTMMFLHGGWLHLIFNMWTLWLFGSTIEDRLGHGRFLVFYFACGVAAAVAHAIFNPTSTAPVLGASGAIAGVLGCFVGLFPLARVVVVVPILFIPLFFKFPAFVFIGLWFLLQLFQGTVELLLPSATGSVAWWAHVGRFVTGLLLVPFIQRSARDYRTHYDDEGVFGFRPSGRPDLPPGTGFFDGGWPSFLALMSTAIQPGFRQRMLRSAAHGGLVLATTLPPASSKQPHDS